MKQEISQNDVRQGQIIHTTGDPLVKAISKYSNC